MAMVSTGEFATVPEACRAAVREAGTVDPEDHGYARRHTIYQSLYPALKPFYLNLTSGE